MICYDEVLKCFHLRTPNSSYVIHLYADTVLEHVYWGARLEGLEGIQLAKPGYIGFAAMDGELAEMEGVEPISTEVFPQEYPTFGSCDMRKPAFHARYADGSRITKLRYVNHKIYPGKPKLEGLPATYVQQDSQADTLEITVADDLTGLTLLYRYTAFADHDAICRNVEVVNAGSKPVELNSVMSCNVDFDRADFAFINLSGAWARERHIDRRSLHTGTTKVESRRGSSSHHQSPFFALTDPNGDEEHGQAYGFSLVYSGNFEAGVEVDTYGQARAFMGINAFDFAWLLEPGQRFTAPEAVMVYSAQGLGGMSRTYHSLYRRHLARGVWRDRPRPVLLNNWEATYFDFTEEKLLDIARCAKDAGIELLVLDDGWFGKRNWDDCSLGDWEVNRQKLPGGIRSLAEKVNAIGLKFGLWFEPEMVSPDSDLYRAHPDWCLHVAGRPRSQCRNQLILDMSRQDVQDYVISFMTRHLSSAPISYIKWDMNRNMSCAGSALLPGERQAETAHRYMLGLYRVLETVVTAFPEVLFEGCSGGGGRFDAGQMHYFNQYWTSDNSDALERQYIQYGTSLVMPACFMGAHVSAVPNHQVHRTTSLKTRGYVAMSGQLGYELDVTKMTPEELQQVAEQIWEYKSIRQTVHNGDMYRIASPFAGSNTGWVYVSADKRSAVMFYFTIMHKTPTLPSRVRVPGLDAGKRYRLRATGEIYSGAVLMHQGISIHHDRDGESDLFVFDMTD